MTAAAAVVLTQSFFGASSIASPAIAIDDATQPAVRPQQQQHQGTVVATAVAHFQAEIQEAAEAPEAIKSTDEHSGAGSAVHLQSF